MSYSHSIPFFLFYYILSFHPFSASFSPSLIFLLHKFLTIAFPSPLIPFPTAFTSHFHIPFPSFSNSMLLKPLLYLSLHPPFVFFPSLWASIILTYHPSLPYIPPVPLLLSFIFYLYPTPLESNLMALSFSLTSIRMPFAPFKPSIAGILNWWPAVRIQTFRVL